MRGESESDRRGLAVRDLRVAYPIDHEEVDVVRGVSFEVDERESVGLVGESGCGKSTLAAALLRLVPPPGKIVGGSIRWDGRELLSLPESELTKFRGAALALAPQDAAAALDPLFSIGWQIRETLAVHRRELSRSDLALESRRWLDRVGLSANRATSYPHQLSGGQLQRAALAVALAARPRLLVADEPTTALDATLEVRLLDLLAELRRELGLALLLITHDLGVVERLCSRVLVMADGEIVESGETSAVFSRPSHPKTRKLAQAAAWIRNPRRLNGPSNGPSDLPASAHEQPAP